MHTDDLAQAIKAGGVGVIPTDTLYGLVGSALLPDAVERIYELKRRDQTKPFIVLIADVGDVEQFGIVLSDELRTALADYWPGAYSIILPTLDEQFEYLHRGSDQIAFRLPDNETLVELLRETGPLVAPSANTEGMPPATNVAEARNYFGTSVDFYVEGEELSGRASTIIEITPDGTRVVRE